MLFVIRLILSPQSGTKIPRKVILTCLSGASKGQLLRNTHTHQVNIRHKVSVQSCRDTKGPNTISQRLPDVDVEDLAHGGTAACAGAGGFDRQQGFVGEAGQYQDEHEDTEDP